MVGDDSFGIDYLSALEHIGDKVSARQRKILAMFALAPENELSGGELAQLLGLSHHAPVNREVSGLGKLLADAAGVAPPVRRNGSPRWWNVIATGRGSEDGRRFLWRLRPHLRDAAKELGLLDEPPDPISHEREGLLEDGAIQTAFTSHERNPVARRLCLSHFGARCVVCSVELGQVYGSVAEGLIHVHHLHPLAAGGASRREVDPVGDLRPVCPNCHAVIHLRNPPYTIEEIQGMLEEQGPSHPNAPDGCRRR